MRRGAHLRLNRLLAERRTSTSGLLADLGVSDQLVRRVYQRLYGTPLSARRLQAFVDAGRWTTSLVIDDWGRDRLRARP